MTAEEKRLLLIDLSARLQYGVKVKVSLPWANDVEFASDIKIRTLNACMLDVVLDNDNPAVKPYLRPMSSMTEEEIKEWDIICVMMRNMPIESISILLKFVNSKHLDYNNLIPKGLALEALEGMYN